MRADKRGCCGLHPLITINAAAFSDGGLPGLHCTLLESDLLLAAQDSSWGARHFGCCGGTTEGASCNRSHATFSEAGRL
jgi:hypothetical protein